jgi:hypothetical protein
MRRMGKPKCEQAFGVDTESVAEGGVFGKIVVERGGITVQIQKIAEAAFAQ